MAVNRINSCLKKEKKVKITKLKTSLYVWFYIYIFYTDHTLLSYFVSSKWDWKVQLAEANNHAVNLLHMPFRVQNNNKKLSEMLKFLLKGVTTYIISDR